MASRTIDNKQFIKDYLDAMTANPKTLSASMSAIPA